MGLKDRIAEGIGKLTGHDEDRAGRFEERVDDRPDDGFEVADIGVPADRGPISETFDENGPGLSDPSAALPGELTEPVDLDEPDEDDPGALRH